MSRNGGSESTTFFCFMASYFLSFEKLDEERIFPCIFDRNMQTLSLKELESLRDYCNEALDTSVAVHRTSTLELSFAYHRFNDHANKEGRIVYMALDKTRGLIKIGISTNPEQRIYQLSKSHRCRMELLHTIENCSRMDEFYIHHFVRHFRVKGEWFQNNVNVYGLFMEAKRSIDSNNYLKEQYRLKRQQEIEELLLEEEEDDGAPF